MRLQRPCAERLGDIAFFAVFLAYVWVGIDTRLIYHWQGTVFSTIPGFLNDFLKYPGGPSDYLYALIAQGYASRGWGAIVLTAQVAAVTALTEVYFTTLAGHALRMVRFVPAALLLYHANLYYDRTPVELALLLGLAAAILFVRLSRRWHSEAALLTVFVVLLGAAYYLGGIALVFFAPAAVFAHMARRPRLPLWIVYLLLAVALPATELLHWIYMPASARDWFAPPDSRLAMVCWGLYAFLTLGTAILLLRRPSSSPQKRRLVPLAALLWTALPLLGLISVAALSYRISSRDRVLTTIDYFTLREDWPAVIDTSRLLATKDFNSLARYEVNLALHEMNRLGDEMFRFPQTGAMLLDIRVDTFLPYMIRLTDMCLRLGRLNEAEHFGSEALIAARADPRLYRLMASISVVKGQTAVARKFLTVLAHGTDSGAWARQRLRELDQDPQLAGDVQVQLLRRRMLRNEDMFQVWQRGDKASADMERLLLDQLEQDPTNRMAFEFLMGTYLLARDGAAVSALMPRIADLNGPAYMGPDGKRRTPRYYQEAMAIFADMTGKPANIEGVEIQPETIERMNAFKRIVSQSPGREAARQASWEGFRDTYFFYALFGPGDYR
jgi:hypothetical protein